jgi:hypothetical protein
MVMTTSTWSSQPADEPRGIEEFGAADATGVRWLPLSEWIEEIS